MVIARSRLKSDTEPPIIAFRHRVAEMCKAEVATEDAVREDKPSNRIIENAVMLLLGVIRMIRCHTESGTPEELREDSPVMPWVGGTCRQHYIQVSLEETI